MKSANISFITGNTNKIKDAQLLLVDFEVHAITIDLPEIQSMDPKEIIEYKLKYAYETCNKPCFVMDTSLSFDGLNGFPGPFIKYFFHAIGDKRICEIIGNQPNKICHRKTCLGYYDGVQSHFFEHIIDWEVPDHPRWSNGYDWDTIFMPIWVNKTLAEMSFEEKQSYAVTKKLLSKFADFLKDKNWKKKF